MSTIIKGRLTSIPLLTGQAIGLWRAGLHIRRGFAPWTMSGDLTAD